MRNIATRIGAIAAPALVCAVAAGTAYAKPPAQQMQRPGETIAQPRTCMPHDGAGDKLRSEFGEKTSGMASRATGRCWRSTWRRAALSP